MPLTEAKSTRSLRARTNFPAPTAIPDGEAFTSPCFSARSESTARPRPNDVNVNVDIDACERHRRHCWGQVDPRAIATAVADELSLRLKS
jgi:hypothetical protein